MQLERRLLPAEEAVAGELDLELDALAADGRLDEDGVVVVPVEPLRRETAEPQRRLARGVPEKIDAAAGPVGRDGRRAAEPVRRPERPEALAELGGPELELLRLLVRDPLDRAGDEELVRLDRGRSGRAPAAARTSAPSGRACTRDGGSSVRGYCDDAVRAVQQALARLRREEVEARRIDGRAAASRPREPSSARPRARRRAPLAARPRAGSPRPPGRPSSRPRPRAAPSRPRRRRRRRSRAPRAPRRARRAAAARTGRTPRPRRPPGGCRRSRGRSARSAACGSRSSGIEKPPKPIASPPTSVSTRFIAGEPMNAATKTFAGWS